LVTRPRSPAPAEILERVEGHIEEIRQELTVEIKRLTLLQVQVDEVRQAVRELKISKTRARPS
jgi:hypothetical protein